MDQQAPPEGEGGLLRACGRCCCCCHRCDEETLLLLGCLLELDLPREGKVPAAVLAGEEGAAESERGDQCGGSEGRRLLCVDEWRGSGRLWEMTGGVGEGRKMRAAVAWGVKKMVELAEEENQKRGGWLLKKDGFKVRFFLYFC